MKTETTGRDLFLLVLALVLVGTAILFDREEGAVRLFGNDLPGICLIKLSTGYDCPSCGMTRSFVAIGDGDVGAAVTANPVGPLLFLVVLLQLPLRATRLVSSRFARWSDAWDGRTHFVVFLFLVAALLLSWLWRLAT